MYGFGANLLLSDGAVVIVSKSCDDNAYFKDIKLPENLKTKRAIVNILGVIIKPLTFEKVNVTLVTSFDPKIAILPKSLLKYFSKKIATGTFKKITSLAQNLEGTIYYERMHSPENKEFYEYLKQSQVEYFATFQQ